MLGLKRTTNPMSTHSPVHGAAYLSGRLRLAGRGGAGLGGQLLQARLSYGFPTTQKTPASKHACQQ